jgi:hypothetical protein
MYDLRIIYNFSTEEPQLILTVSRESVAERSLRFQSTLKKIAKWQQLRQDGSKHGTQNCINGEHKSSFHHRNCPGCVVNYVQKQYVLAKE